MSISTKNEDGMRWISETFGGIGLLSENKKEMSAFGDGLVEAIRESVCRYTLGHIIARLTGSVIAGFAEEEKLMLSLGYPEYFKHRAEHEGFIGDVFELELALLRIERKPCAFYELTVEVNRMIADWRYTHMAETDGRLEAFLKGRPVCVLLPA